MNLNLQEIRKAIKGEIIKDSGAIFDSVSIDTRKLKEGELFFALRGNTTDGHLYIEDAVEKGARGIVISDSNLANYWKEKVGVILVDDTLKALHRLANYVRKKLNATIICITGSMGKTTTKDYAAQIISSYKKVMKSEGNLNSITGLPLSLIKINPDCEVVILEMATNKKGEIAVLTKISEPNIGVILNIAEVHLEYLGSIEEIAKEKLSLVENLNKNSQLIYNKDDKYLKNIDWQYKFSYGMKEESDIMIKDLSKKEVGYEGYFYEDKLRYHFNFYIRGVWNIYNLLAAVSIARKVGINWTEIIERIKYLEVSEMRGKIINLGNGVKIIDESYNSNPRSLLMILHEFDMMNSEGRKIAIIGDMYELGGYAERFHREVIQRVSNMKIDIVIGIGTMMSEAIKNVSKKNKKVKISFINFITNDECRDFVKDFIKPGDLLLVKGSRAVKLDEIINSLKIIYGVIN